MRIPLTNYEVFLFNPNKVESYAPILSRIIACGYTLVHRLDKYTGLIDADKRVMENSHQEQCTELVEAKKEAIANKTKLVTLLESVADNVYQFNFTGTTQEAKEQENG